MSSRDSEDSQTVATVDHLTLPTESKDAQVVKIIASILNFPTTEVPMSKSFFELGGDSIGMISALVKLKERDMHISLHDFDSAKTIDELIEKVQITKNIRVLGEASRSRYAIKSLAEAGQRETILQIFAESLTTKEPLHYMLGITVEEFMPFAQAVYEEAIKGNESFLVMNVGEDIVGGVFMFDFHAPVPIVHHAKAAPVFALLDELERPMKEKLKRESPGKWMYNFCIFVRLGRIDHEEVTICHLLEDHVTKVAKEAGYKGILVTNTNSVTKNMCRHFHGYEVVTKYLVKELEYKGEKVYAHAPDDFFIELAMKRL